MIQLRCPNRNQAVVIFSDGTIEVRCRDRYCGAGQGFVVLHKYNVRTGELIHTARYRDPFRRNE